MFCVTTFSKAPRRAPSGRDSQAHTHEQGPDSCSLGHSEATSSWHPPDPTRRLDCSPGSSVDSEGGSHSLLYWNACTQMHWGSCEKAGQGEQAGSKSRVPGEANRGSPPPTCGSCLLQRSCLAFLILDKVLLADYMSLMFPVPKYLRSRNSVPKLLLTRFYIHEPSKA